jgi:hypothetical protein
VVSAATDVHSRIVQLEDRLNPRRARAAVIDELNQLFREGTAPDPAPDGLLRGRAVSSTISPTLDALGRRMAAIYMPWLGKKFDSGAGGGINVLTASALRPMKIFWPSYEPAHIYVDRVEAFPFTTRVDAGAVDPGLRVLKIDYDFDANPSFIIRRVLDELVDIGDGVYLGKVLYRMRDRFHLIGFFTLEK